MTQKIDEKIRQEIIRLRVEERLSIDAIRKRVLVSVGAISQIVRAYPLEKTEVLERMIANGHTTSSAKPRGEPSKFWSAIEYENLSPSRKGKIAEAAVAFRLTLHGFHLYSSPFDGDTYDWLVEVPTSDRIWKVQVKNTQISSNGYGLPYIPIRHADGRSKLKRYRQSECDFIIGYDLFSDTAYIYSWDDIQHIGNSISVSDAFAERWDKML
jgi:hypothetical protein